MKDYGWLIGRAIDEAVAQMFGSLCVRPIVLNRDYSVDEGSRIPQHELDGHFKKTKRNNRKNWHVKRHHSCPLYLEQHMVAYHFPNCSGAIVK